MAITRYVVFILVIVIPFSLALQGYVYDISLEKIPYAVVSVYSIDGELLSRQLADDTAYYDMPIPKGKYFVVAYKPGTNLYSNETVDIISSDQRYDILLSPKLDYEKLPKMDLPGIGELPETNDISLITNGSEKQKIPDLWWIVILSVFVFILGAVILLKIRRKHGSVKHTDEEYLLSIIEENNGSIKQKELVKITGWSEAKVSLVLKELKRKGKVKKKKVGREKIVFLAS